MSELNVRVRWGEPTDPDIGAVAVNVQCTDGNHALVFPAPNAKSETIVSDGRCTVQVSETDSNIEVDESDCPSPFDLRETNQSCDLFAVGFNTGVPAYTDAGLAVLIVAVLSFGMYKLFRRA